jgi:hypothetical protein
MSKFARIENERSPRARRACLALLLAAAPALAAATAIPSAFHGT